nr:MAG TPA: hypothetical protein [Caudoviricetes sp.]
MLTVNTIGINRVVISLILFFRFLFFLLILITSHSYLIVYSLFYSQLRKPSAETLEVKSFLLLTATGLMLLPETYLSLLVFYALHSQNKIKTDSQVIHSLVI